MTSVSAGFSSTCTWTFGRTASTRRPVTRKEEASSLPRSTERCASANTMALPRGGRTEKLAHCKRSPQTEPVSRGSGGTGTVLSGAQTGPLAFVGTLTFDGAGQLTANLSQRLSAGAAATTLIKVPYTGTYSVNADCTIEDTWTNMLNGTSSVHESVIVDRGRGLFILNTTIGAPNIVSAVGRKLFGGDEEED